MNSEEVTPQQRRIIMSLARRNQRGWGQPFSFTLRQMGIGIGFLAAAAIFSVLDTILYGTKGAVDHQQGISGLLGLLTLLAFSGLVSYWWFALPAYLAARYQRIRVVSGRIKAIINNVNDILPFLGSTYTFITLEEDDGRIRAYAIAPKLAPNLGEVGSRITLEVAPGIEYVLSVQQFVA